MGNGIALEHEALTQQIIGAAIEAHRALGPGLLESGYEACLAHALLNRGLRVRRQAELPIEFDGVKVDCGYRIDLIVNELVVIELKAIVSCPFTKRSSSPISSSLACPLA